MANSPKEHLLTLIDFFFHKKCFKLIKPQDDYHPFWISDFLKTRCGNAILITLLFYDLAFYSGLSIKLLQIGHSLIAKIIDKSGTYYFDLERLGQLLTSQEVLHMINHSSGKQSDGHIQEISPFHLLIKYFIELYEFFNKQKDFETALHSLNLLITLQPQNTQLLAQRALLLNRLNYKEEALLDLKRYFSFCHPSLCSHEILNTFKLLDSIK